MTETDAREPMSVPVKLALTRGLLIGAAEAVLFPIPLTSLAATCGFGSTPLVACAAVAGLVVGVAVAVATWMDCRFRRSSALPVSLVDAVLVGVIVGIASMLTLSVASAQAVYLAGAISTSSVHGGFLALSAFCDEWGRNAGGALTTFATAALPFALFGFARHGFCGFWIPTLFVGLGTPLTLILVQPTVYFPWQPWDEPSPFLLSNEAILATLVIGFLLPVLWHVTSMIVGPACE